MKTFPVILAVSIFAFAACDGEKVDDAKKQSAEAAKSLGDAAKEIGGKMKEKTVELGKAAGEKIKEASVAIGEKGGPALEGFKTGMSGFSEWLRGMKGKAGDNPAAAQGIFGEMGKKLKLISTQGVPPDLKNAFNGYQNSIGRLQAMVRTMPADPAAAQEWVKEKADPLRALELDTTGALKIFKETAARYGLTGLDLGE